MQLLWGDDMMDKKKKGEKKEKRGMEAEGRHKPLTKRERKEKRKRKKIAILKKIGAQIIFCIPLWRARDELD
jgi:hypothetical protein